MQANKLSGPYFVTDYIVRKHEAVGKSSDPLDIVGLKVRNGPAPVVGGAAPKFWNMADVGEDEAEITMYGEIVDHHPVDWWTGEPEPGLFISPEGFLEDLAKVRTKNRVTVRINSIGGDLYTGMAIYNQLKALPGQKTVIVDGIAASAASVIAMAGDVIQISIGGTVMIHEPSVTLFDSYDQQQLKGVIKMLDAASRSAAEVYAEKTGLEIDAIRSMMAKTTWMIGQEAIDKGFATDLMEGVAQMTMSTDKSALLVGGLRFSAKGLRNIPQGIPVKDISPAAAAPRPTAGIQKNTTQGGKQIMTMEELRAAHPELVAQVEGAAQAAARDEAMAAERARIQAIEEIAPGVGDAKLVQDAKFGEHPCTAPELALKAMQQQAKLGTQHLQNTAADFAASGAAAVGAVPNGGAGSEPDDEAKQVDTVVGAYMMTKGGKKK